MVFGTNLIYISIAIYLNSLGCLIVLIIFFLIIVKYVVATEEKRLLNDFEADYMKYKEMGEPSLFWNNSMKTGWATLKYLFKCEHKGLNDNLLSLLSDSMLVLFVIYTVLFFSLFLFMLSDNF